ncbi:hypothetical protein [Zobellella iuensis]|uniref:DUF4136 domain-containing protein n=1 Tax=Zobellella iuensis TaxID=2803811 RepID=A0ABS1QWQ8_9GAMM|nr:hypothetical protein [Zobellella iuensis]MBL1379191.1 hypothetical protein [Zobellella iuensis]
MIKAGLALTVFATLAGCASTDITSFTDPEFMGKKYNRFLVVTPGVNLEYASLLQGALCGAIIEKGGGCIRGLELFPPTRVYEEQAVTSMIQQKGIDGYLIVDYGGNVTREHNFGYVAQGNANVWGNTITAYGSAIPMSTFSRNDGYQVTLFDTATNKKSWVGGASTHAQGLANVTNSVFTSSLAKALAEQLSKAGHL